MIQLELSFSFNNRLSLKYFMVCFGLLVRSGKRYATGQNRRVHMILCLLDFHRRLAWQGIGHTPFDEQIMHPGQTVIIRPEEYMCTAHREGDARKKQAVQQGRSEHGGHFGDLDAAKERASPPKWHALCLTGQSTFGYL